MRKELSPVRERKMSIGGAAGTEGGGGAGILSGLDQISQAAGSKVASLLDRKRAGDVCTDRMLPTITPETKLLDVLEELQDAPCVVLPLTRPRDAPHMFSKHGSDTIEASSPSLGGCESESDGESTEAEGEEELVLTREAVAKRVVWTGVADVTIEQWLSDLPASGLDAPISPPEVHEHDSLAQVLRVMGKEGTCNEVVIRSLEGRLLGLLSRDHTYTAVTQEMVVASRRQLRTSAGARTFKQDIRFEPHGEDAMMGKPEHAPFSPMQNRVVSFLELPMSRLFILILLITDTAINVYEMVKLSPCVDCAGEWDDTEKNAPPGGFASEGACREENWLQDCTNIRTLTSPLSATTAALMAIFFAESLLRLFVWRTGIVKKTMELFDVTVTWVVCALFVWFLAEQGPGGAVRNIVAFGRILRFFRFFTVASALRSYVGKEKSRYQKNGFDLDLSYITESCIAMSLPATGLEAKYRNPMGEVVRFFRTVHQDELEARFLIFNLCVERQYSPQLFGGQVETFPTEDHNPCLLEQICSCVERAEGFQLQHPLNVIAVHCKGGKGRTGLMVCCWLLYSGFCGPEWEQGVDPITDALEWFALRRTGKKAKHRQGVGQPSQRRYINYFYKTMTMGGYRTPTLALRKIVMHSCPKMDSDGGCDPWFIIEQKWKEVFDYSKVHKVENMRKGQQSIELSCEGVELRGDVRISFYDHDEFPPRDEKMFFFWFHTGFIENNYLRLLKPEIDGAAHDRSCAVYHNDFAVELFFSPVPHSRIPYRRLERASTETLEKHYIMSDTLRSEEMDKKRPFARASSVLNDKAGGQQRGNFLKQKLSSLLAGDTRRFQAEGFDLDLTYITSRVLVVGNPAKVQADASHTAQGSHATPTTAGATPGESKGGGGNHSASERLPSQISASLPSTCQAALLVPNNTYCTALPKDSGICNGFCKLNTLTAPPKSGTSPRTPRRSPALART